MYEKNTHNVWVRVRPVFMQAESYVEEGTFCWTYYVHIENKSDETLQLKRRYWHITDANGLVREIEGEGVIGETPTLSPTQSHHYDSFVYLTTDNGIMHGYYQMQVMDGHRAGQMITIAVPAFSLDSDTCLALPN